MSTMKSKKNTWGGKRTGAGRPGGSGQKQKICVSVNEQNWHVALSLWKPEKPSHLVDGLVSRYVDTGGSLIEKGAAL